MTPVPRNPQEISAPGVAWLDADDFDDGSGRYLLAYRLEAAARETSPLELQFLINGAAPWHSVADVYAEARSHEERIAERNGIAFVNDPERVEASLNA